MAKKYVGNNTLNKIIDVLVAALPSKEITEAEVQAMYEAAPATDESGTT